VIAVAVTVAPVLADLPFPNLSSCTISITQFPLRPACLNDWEPDVIRLTPAGSNATPVFDRASITVRVRDTLGEPLPGAFVSFMEMTGIVNVANDGSTTAVTDETGLATISIHAGSGYGRVALCADGVVLCNLQVRSPDVTKGASPMQCGLSTSVTSVAGNDITNPMCGFLVTFGAVTPGINDGYDLSCDGAVSGADVTGQLGKGGVLQYFGDWGTLGALNACPP
jgi:hypothetical protein